MRIFIIVFAFILSLDGAQAQEALNVASFNIQNFGKTKAGKEQILSYLAGIIRKFDIVAIQEIKDVSGEVPDIFLAEINKTGRSYRYLLSERTGQQENDKSSQEQYAFYYDNDKVEPQGPGALFDDSAEDLFQREPFTAQFRLKNTNFTLTLTTIHTRPESAVEEIGALYTVYRNVQKRYPSEAHHLILGDFNAGCSYASPKKLDKLEIRSAEFVWIVPDEADTNVNPKSDCAYDRFVANTKLYERFKKWGVGNWFKDKKISDHWPVWVTFSPVSP